MPVHLLPGLPAPNANTIAPSTVSKYANRLHVSANGHNGTAIWWYRRTTTQPPPQALYLWNQSSGAVIQKITTDITDNGAVGWQRRAIDTVALVVGTNYAVGVRSGSSSFDLARLSAAVGPDAPIIFDGYYIDNFAADEAPPTTLQTGEALVNLELDGEPADGGGGGTVPADVATEGDFAAWLSNVAATNTHQSDGLPWQTKLDTASTLVLATAINAILGTRAAGDTRTIWTIILQLLAYLVANEEHIFNILDWLGGLSKPPEQDALAAILNRIDVRVEALWDDRQNAGWADGAVLCPDRHTLVDSFPFSGQVGWGSGHALHRIHIDTTDDRHPFIDLGAAGWWVPGVGWWAPTLPDGSLGRRTVLEFADQWLWPVPSCATGLIVWVHPSVTGTLYAYSVP